MNCEHGYGYSSCTAPNTQCPHWQGTFCDLDIVLCNSCKNRGNNKKCFACYWQSLNTFTKEGEA